MPRCKDPSIPEFFAGKTVFVTGGHGFIGKAFTEKLLRSCGNVGTIYWLIRRKRAIEPEQRLRMALENVLFDKLRTENPETLNKVKVMAGDIQEENLGLSQENLNILLEQVQIVVHSAATVKFNEPLNVAIKLNVKGTREVTQLVLKIKNLTAFCYVSTLYCQQDKPIVEEKFYPASADWRQAIEIAENCDQHQLNILCSKFVGAFPNTYVFSKSLAEHCVHDMCNGKAPLVVFRPGIVIPIYESPLMGWADGITGPTGLTYGIIAGVLKVQLIDSSKIDDNIPVDYLVKGMISSIYKKGLESAPLEETPYYNGCYNSISYDQIKHLFDEIVAKLRISSLYFSPSLNFQSNNVIFLFYFYIFQLLPAFLFDLGHKIALGPPKFSMVKLQKKVFENIQIYKHFTMNEWKFHNGNFMGVLTRVREDDFGEFGVPDRPNPTYDTSYAMHSLHFLHERILGRKLTKEAPGIKKIKMLKRFKNFLNYFLYLVIGYFSLRFFQSYI